MSDLGKEARAAAQKGGVAIVGRHSLQLRLLADLIGERLGRSCEVRTASEIDARPLPPTAQLLLLDFESLPSGNLCAQIQALVKGTRLRDVALLNADDAAALRDFIHCAGVKGYFSSDVSQQQLLKGVEAILAGEYWLPRRLLVAHLEQTRARLSLGAASAVRVPLTRKETETLKLLLGGSRNSHIARRLNVSTHTVKTHLYNLFRKIQVSNRVQAVRWAMSNIDPAERDRP